MWGLRYAFFLCFLCGCALLLASPAQAASFPKPVDDYVNDYASVLKSPDLESICELLRGVRSQTGQEMTVVTIGSVPDYAGAGETLESFATALFDEGIIAANADTSA